MRICRAWGSGDLAFLGFWGPGMCGVLVEELGPFRELGKLGASGLQEPGTIFPLRN